VAPHRLEKETLIAPPSSCSIMAGQIHPSRQAYVEEAHEVRYSLQLPALVAHFIFTITPTASVPFSTVTGGYINKDEK
jgi:hypothetical protein